MLVRHGSEHGREASMEFCVSQGAGASPQDSEETLALDVHGVYIGPFIFLVTSHQGLTQGIPLGQRTKSKSSEC